MIPQKYFLSFSRGMATGVVATLLFIILFSPFEEPRTETIFVYGTLTNPLIRTYACWCIVDSTPATLIDYQKDGLNVIPKQDSQADGRLITISQAELARIDRYENVPKKYWRSALTVASTTAWIYIKN